MRIISIYVKNDCLQDIRKVSYYNMPQMVEFLYKNEDAVFLKCADAPPYKFKQGLTIIIQIQLANNEFKNLEIDCQKDHLTVNSEEVGGYKLMYDKIIEITESIMSGNSVVQDNEVDVDLL